MKANEIRDIVCDNFKKSNKNHLIITGDRGIGKTTLVNSIIELLNTSEDKKSISGIITRLDIDDLGNKKIILKSTLQGDWIDMAVFENGELIVDKHAWDIVAVKYLSEVIESKAEIVFIDEIGFVELEFESYLNQIIKAFDNKHVIAVLRKMDSDFHIGLKSRDDVYVVDVEDYRKRR